MSQTKTKAKKADNDFAKKLQDETSGVRLNSYQLTSKRTMSKGQIAEVADLFGAEADSVSGSRAALNRKHELVAPVYRVLLKARRFVTDHTLDYPEKGLRLIKLSRVEWLRDQVQAMSDELQDAVDDLAEGWDEVKAEAKGRLKKLYSEADYPATPKGVFGLELSFPAIKPDDRLLQLHPELYAQEQARIAARFDDAVKSAEAAAADQLGKLLERFVTQLSEPEDGKKRILKASVVDSITEFTERFKNLSIGSNSGLDELVAKVEQLASGVDVAAVRKFDGDVKKQLQEKVASLVGEIDKLVIARPVREVDLD